MHSVVPLGVVMAYSPTLHRMKQRWPTRTAAGEQSASPNAVLGVGSEQCHDVPPPLQSLHDSWQVLQTAVPCAASVAGAASAYLPPLHALTQEPPSSSGKMDGGHAELTQGLKTHAVH